MSVLSFPLLPCYWCTINHIPGEELVFQLAICKNNKYFICKLSFVPENPTEQQKENKIPQSLKIIDLSIMFCNRAVFLLFQVRPAMSHVCRSAQCIRHSISPSTFLSTLDIMVTSFSNVNNFFFPVFKDKALYNFFPPFLLAGVVIKEFSTAIYHLRTELMPQTAAPGNQFPRSVVVAFQNLCLFILYMGLCLWKGM